MVKSEAQVVKHDRELRSRATNDTGAESRYRRVQNTPTNGALGGSPQTRRAISFKTPKQQNIRKQPPQTSVTRRQASALAPTPRHRKSDYTSLIDHTSGKKGQRKENGLVELTKKFIYLLVTAEN